MTWWWVGVGVIGVLYVLVALTLFAALVRGKRADAAAGELCGVLSTSGGGVDDLVVSGSAPYAMGDEAVASSMSAKAVPERPYRMFEDFDLESAWQKHERAFEDDYQAGVR